MITTPAYFGGSQRQSTKDASKIADLNAIRIVNDPTASNLNWGLGKQETEIAKIFDLGGGTFDVSVIEVRRGTTLIVVYSIG